MDVSAWLQVRTRDGRLALRLPPDWEVEPPTGDSQLVASAPGGYEAAVLYVTAEETDGPVSSQEYKIGQVIFLQQVTPGYEEHGGGEWTAEEQEVSWHSFSRTDRNGTITFLAFFLVAGGTAYTVIAGAPAESFPSCRSVLEAIGASLRCG